ncbi:hypothetical protein JYU29_07445 [Tianweitania sp. BSSL-BM11]|uniref:PhoP regulatory network protein YrbL n=1 Tax=Tianweitania aestuarii TaxID=2814886 RepID=A0ABS5RTY2_9HYPH|nr:YrbL family protein [Tianweitania aestuarii]MBS9720516.1 hypothetical protein [Tianweitania aestuarii]
MSHLKLSGRDPLGIGRQRFVFQHPLDPDLVLKIPLRHVLDDERTRPRPRYHRRYLFRHLADTYSEMRAHLVLYARLGELPPRIAKFHGFVETDLGLAEVCELKRGADGQPASSLRQMLADGVYGAPHRAALERFLDWVVSSDLTLKELHPGNLVYADVGADTEEFVLVDGVGEKGQLSLRSRFRRLNRWHKRKHIKILLEKVRAEEAAGRSAQAAA